MSIRKAIVMELKHEAANTHKMFERLAPEQFGYKPHDKSYTLGKLAGHVADLPGWITMVLTSEEFNLADKPFNREPVTTAETLLELHNNHVTAAVQALENATDEQMMEDWTLRMGDHVIVKMPRAAVIRSLAMNHMIHHRGQLSVYMRLNDVPLPGIYGPSADEQ